MGTLLKQLEQVAPTMGRAKAAHACWAMIKSVGYTQTQQIMPRATFYKHTALLRLAGVSSADLCAGTIIPFRQRSLVLQSPVSCWEDIDIERAA